MFEERALEYGRLSLSPCRSEHAFNVDIEIGTIFEKNGARSHRDAPERGIEHRIACEFEKIPTNAPPTIVFSHLWCYGSMVVESLVNGDNLEDSFGRSFDLSDTSDHGARSRVE